MNQRDIIRECLEDENIRTDALVTKQHADDLADELAAAFQKRRLVITHKRLGRDPS